MIEIPSLKELLDVGAHFGHKKERSYPKSKPFIYVLKDQIYVINLEVTREKLKIALEYIEELASNGKTILMVGTKRQAANVVEKVGKDVGTPYINYRWLGGMLTNFETIKKRLKYMDEQEAKLADVDGGMTKREKVKLEEELAKLHKTFDGIKDLKQLPDALFIVDMVKEKTAVDEARKIGITVVGIADTNANPELVDYPIPANDDAWKSVEMIVGLVGKAITQGKSKIKKIEVKEEIKEKEEGKELKTKK